MNARHRFLTACGAAVVMGAVVSFATMPIAGQSQTTTRDPEKVKEEERKLIRDVAESLKKQESARSLPAEVLKNWKTARTPWGDPDLTGVYTNSDESGIPFEKPAEFGGRRLEDITAAELAELQRARQDAIIERADGTKQAALKEVVMLNAGDRVRIHSGGGGGYGDPKRRHRDLVQSDVRRGYISAEAARKVYAFDESKP